MTVPWKSKHFTECEKRKWWENREFTADQSSASEGSFPSNTCSYRLPSVCVSVWSGMFVISWGCLRGFEVKNPQQEEAVKNYDESWLKCLVTVTMLVSFNKRNILRLGERWITGYCSGQVLKSVSVSSAIMKSMQWKVWIRGSLLFSSLHVMTLYVERQFPMALFRLLVNVEWKRTW